MVDVDFNRLLGVTAAEENPYMHCVRTAWKEAAVAGQEYLPLIRYHFPSAASTRCSQCVGRNDSCLPVSFLSELDAHDYRTRSRSSFPSLMHGGQLGEKGGIKRRCFRGATQ